MWLGLYLFIYLLTALTFARGTCLRALLVCIAVYAIADDSPISDETSPVTEGMCSIGIVVRVLCVNVFIVVEELWEGFETAERLPCVGFLGLLYAASSAAGRGRC